MSSQTTWFGPLWKQTRQQEQTHNSAAMDLKIEKGDNKDLDDSKCSKIGKIVQYQMREQIT